MASRIESTFRGISYSYDPKDPAVRGLSDGQADVLLPELILYARRNGIFPDECDFVDNQYEGHFRGLWKRQKEANKTRDPFTEDCQPYLLILYSRLPREDQHKLKELARRTKTSQKPRTAESPLAEKAETSTA